MLLAHLISRCVARFMLLLVLIAVQMTAGANNRETPDKANSPSAENQPAYRQYQLDHNTANPELAQALAAIKDHKFAKAISLLQQSGETNADPIAQFYLALAQFRLDDLKAANNTLDHLLPEHPGFDDALYLKGLVDLSLISEVSIFKKISTAKSALDSWQRAVGANPKNLDAHYALFAFYANAPRIAGGDLKEAAILQARLADMDEGYGALAQGLLESQLGNLEFAEVKFVEASQLLNRAGGYFALAQFYLQQERYINVISSIEAFVAADKRWFDPDPAVAHLFLARAHAGLGEKDEARAQLDLALEFTPNRRVRKLIDEALSDL